MLTAAARLSYKVSQSEDAPASFKMCHVEGFYFPFVKKSERKQYTNTAHFVLD